MSFANTYSKLTQSQTTSGLTRTASNSNKPRINPFQFKSPVPSTSSASGISLPCKEGGASKDGVYIFRTTTQEKVEVKCTEADTVLTLKQKFFEKDSSVPVEKLRFVVDPSCHFPAKQFTSPRLMFSTRVLQDSETLKDAQVPLGAVLYHAFEGCSPIVASRSRTESFRCEHLHQNTFRKTDPMHRLRLRYCCQTKTTNRGKRSYLPCGNPTVLSN